MNFTLDDTINYYDSFGDMYELVWDQQIHTGYFDTDKPLGVAVEDMTKYLANLLKLKSSMTVLDAGSGQGGVDRFLAQNFGVNVIGIDISKKQIEKAITRTVQLGLTEKIKYIEASMTDIPSGKETVDVVWAQESFFHCHDKPRAIDEFYRVLKPGGAVIIEDTILKNAQAKQEIIESFGLRVKVNELWTEDDYLENMKKAGFTVEQTKDFSQYLLVTYTKIIEFIRNNKSTLEIKVSEIHKKALERDFNFPRTLEFVREDKLGCIVILAKKPI